MKLNNESGASMVEFALVLPLLIVLVFGSIEFGLLLFNRQVITNASREGARFGIVSATPRRTDAEITSIVQRYTDTNLITLGPPADPSVTCTRTGTNWNDDLTVQVQYHYDFLVIPNFIPAYLGGTDLVASTMMKYE